MPKRATSTEPQQREGPSKRQKTLRPNPEDVAPSFVSLYQDLVGVAGLDRVAGPEKASPLRTSDKVRAVVKPEEAVNDRDATPQFDRLEIVLQVRKEVQGRRVQAWKQCEPSAKRVLVYRAAKLYAALNDLDSMVDQEGVKKEVFQYLDYLIFCHQEGRACHSLGHIQLAGPSGAGKTWMAQVLARLLFALGLSSQPEVITVVGTQLEGRYEGQTAGNILHAVAGAWDGVLFIDEAYSLAEGAYAQKAMATLMTVLEDYKDHVTVFLAGYPAHMSSLAFANQGYSSRISRWFQLEALGKDSLTQFLVAKTSLHLEWTPEAQHRATTCFETMVSKGDGRSICPRHIEKLSERLSEILLKRTTVTPDDIQEACHQMFDPIPLPPPPSTGLSMTTPETRSLEDALDEFMATYVIECKGAKSVSKAGFGAAFVRAFPDVARTFGLVNETGAYRTKGKKLPQLMAAKYAETYPFGKVSSFRVYHNMTWAPSAPDQVYPTAV